MPTLPRLGAAPPQAAEWLPAPLPLLLPLLRLETLARLLLPLRPPLRGWAPACKQRLLC
jgi:hypothetical protein